jgi:hypothetical protein
MPFKSQAQRGFMYAKHPRLANEFEAATPPNAKLPVHVAKMADGGEVKENDNGTLVGLRDLLRKIQGDRTEASQANSIDPVYQSSDTVKGYAPGGEVLNSMINPQDIPSPVMPMSLPPTDEGPGPDDTPSISDTVSSLNSTPDTNYNFYGNVDADKRAALYKQLLDQQRSPGNMMAQAAGGIGDAISNSFGGQHNKFQDEARGIAEQNTTNRIGAMDTQRGQKLQDMQGNQEMMMNDPNSPLSVALRDAANKQLGMKVGSQMPASALLKVFPAFGQLAEKQQAMGIQQQIANQTGTHQKVEENIAKENTGIKANEEKRAALKDTASHYLTHPVNAYKASGELGNMGLEDGGMAPAAPQSQPSGWAPDKEARYQEWKASQGR